MKSPGNKPRAGAVRKTRKGPQVGSGGQGRQALEGKKPTPKAVDRPYHPAGKRKAANERFEAAAGRKKQAPDAITTQRREPRRSAKSPDESEMVTGRNSVLEALRAKIPVTTLYLAARIEFDDRVKEILQMATSRGIPILEIMRPELDRLAGFDAVHQGVALKVPPYEYAHPAELLQKIIARGQVPLLVALDGVTDPRNLGAIIRSVAAFGGHGVIVPLRRSVGLTAAAWKTSAGAAARTPVAMASNLTQMIKDFQKNGVFVLGLDGNGDTPLPDLQLAKEPVLVIVGSEGKGLSR
ncbi:MAG: TrmH family RNA methyltransferase, partial [Rhodoglobus sp.]